MRALGRGGGSIKVLGRGVGGIEILGRDGGGIKLLLVETLAVYCCTWAVLKIDGLGQAMFFNSSRAMVR